MAPDSAGDIEIVTARLRLRRARMDDLPAIHAILSDGQAMRYWSTLPHTTLDQSRAWLADMVAASPTESDDFVIEHAGKVIGKAGCWHLPEIGFILHPNVWGLGLAREAVAAAIAHILAHHPIDAILADVDPRNAASLGLLGSLGFVETGRAARTIIVGDDWCDSIYLARSRVAPRC
jgi:ribosomal-protein-alanine N-acetyltransferase